MKSSSPAMPADLKFQKDPDLQWSQDYLKGQTNYLTQGLTTEGGSLSGLLGDSINVSPLVSQYSMQLAQSQLDPAFRTRQQDMMNQLEANNQLTGSTTASSLSNLNADYMASLTGMQAQYGLADVSRALQNRVQLYGMGLNTGQSVGSTALQNQNQMNQFALSNYENQIAAAMMGEGNKSGGMAGALTGAIGGGLAGFALGGPWGAAIGAGAGGLAGGFSPQSSNVGGGLMQAGGYALGSKYASPSMISGGSESIFNPSTSFTGGSGSLQNAYGLKSSFGY